MSIELPPGSKKYRYSFMIKGVRYRGPTGETDKRKAEQFERRVMDQVRRDRAHGLTDDTATAANRTVLDAVSRYLEKKKTDGMDDRQHKDISRILEWCVDELGPDTLITALTYERVQVLVTKRKGLPKLGGRVLKSTGKPKPVAGATVNRTWQHLRSVVIHARDEGVPVPHIRWGKLAVKEAPPRIRTLTYEEEAKLLSSGDTYANLCRFGLASGLRRENFINLTWDQVSWENETVTVTQKGGETHVIAIDSEIREVLEAERGKDPVHVWTYVAHKTWEQPRTGFRYLRGSRYPITESGFVSWLKRQAKLHRIRDLRTHDLRRTYGSRLLQESGGNLKLVSEQLGHSDVSVTAKHYAHIISSDKRAMLDRSAERVRARRAAALAQVAQAAQAAQAKE
jgi:integrase